MDILPHIQLLARYNRWMNDKVYDAAGKLSPDELERDRGAFFRSLLGTLNHIMVGDIVWLQRLGGHPRAHPALEPVRRMERPAALNQILYRNLPSLVHARKTLDAIIIAWVEELTPDDLDHVLNYQNMKGVPQRRP